MISRACFALPLLFLPAATQLASAQPADAPSSIKKPEEFVRGLRQGPPDPPQITTAELQTLTGGPTLVTFSGTDITVEAATKALLDAARLPESPFQMQNRGEKRTFSVDWQQMPFWTAAAELEKLSGRTWSGRFGNGLVMMQPGGQMEMGLDALNVAQTPFVRVIANSMVSTSTRSVSFGSKQPPRTVGEQTRINLSVYFDPKLPVQSTSARALKFTKQGETAPLAQQEDPFNLTLFGRPNNRLIADVTVPFPQGTKQGTTFSRISGILHNVITSAREVFAVPDMVATPKVTKTIGNGRYELQDVSVNGDGMTIRLVVTTGVDRQNPFVLRVRDSQRRDLSPGGSSISGGPNMRATFTYRLRNTKGEAVPGPYSLEWTIPTETRSYDVPFELRDITVP